MVKVCFLCRRTSEKDSQRSYRSYHMFPTDPAERLLWFEIIGIEPVTTKNIHLCSDHFEPDSFSVGVKGRRVLKKGVRPCTCPHSTCNDSDSECSSSCSCTTSTSSSESETDTPSKFGRPKLAPRLKPNSGLSSRNNTPSKMQPKVSPHSKANSGFNPQYNTSIKTEPMSEELIIKPDPDSTESAPIKQEIKPTAINEKATSSMADKLLKRIKESLDPSRKRVQSESEEDGEEKVGQVLKKTHSSGGSTTETVDSEKESGMGTTGENVKKKIKTDTKSDNPLGDTPLEVVKNWTIAITKIQEQSSKIRTLQQQAGRLKSRMNQFKSVLDAIKANKLVTEEMISNNTTISKSSAEIILRFLKTPVPRQKPTPKSQQRNGNEIKQEKVEVKEEIEVKEKVEANSSSMDTNITHNSSTASPAEGTGTDLQNPGRKRNRTVFKSHQLKIMKAFYAVNPNPNAKDFKQLSVKTGASKRQLQVWFQNTRAKWRKSSGGPEGTDISSNKNGSDEVQEPNEPNGSSLTDAV